MRTDQLQTGRPETVEIYSKVIFDRVLHVAEVQSEPVEGWGPEGIAKILSAIDHDYADIITAFYADVQRRLSGEYEMWAKIESLDLSRIRFEIDGEVYTYHGRFDFYEGDPLPGWRPFG